MDDQAGIEELADDREWVKRLKRYQVASESDGEAFDRKERNARARRELALLAELGDLPGGWRMEVFEQRRPRPDRLASVLVRTLEIRDPSGELIYAVDSPRAVDLVAVAASVGQALELIYDSAAPVAPQAPPAEGSPPGAAVAPSEG